MELTYGVIGTGAIGGFYGGILSDTGKNVNFLINSDYDFVKQNGLYIDSAVFGKIKCKGNYYDTVEKMPKCDILLVGLKTNKNYLLQKLLPSVLKNDSLVILIQNGLGAEQDLEKVFPDIKIAGGVAQILSHKSSPGIIRHQQLGNLSLGSFNDKDDSKLEQVIKDFNETSKIICTKKNLNYSRWNKLLWNIPFNGLSVILNAQTDKLINNKSMLNLIEEIMGEVVSGAKACGVEISEKLIKEQIEITKKMPSYSPSMKLDFDNHRKMEIHYMYEKPIKMALEKGYYMSKVDMIAKLLHFAEDEHSC
ncbi:2-dehydropantoate 2-reductase [Apibacter raozihei]|uniref:2-dehydropantoate 2-reductase n=1 Tax=Apibacter raozihei TaxID=2500547 RepID=UPI000FE3F092|nr:2-dehydropantoate 2-reductase [Apibacter raozihei]